MQAEPAMPGTAGGAVGMPASMFRSLGGAR